MIDFLIIGGGAAGLYAASLIKDAVILERNDECGRKLLLTGGGRCNYTHTGSVEDLLEHYHGSRQFIKKVLYQHCNEDIIAHFEKLGINPKNENDKIFPQSGDAHSIRDALLGNHPRIIKGTALSIEKSGDSFLIITDNGTLEAKRILFASGGNSFPKTGSDGLGYSILKLLFFLILWFVVGIYLIPLFLKRVRGLMNAETLLIVSLALCFGMVVLAASVGFSPAFGAFIMGSILSETVESDHIEKLVAPVKDLFGAIFFVSVGMMVDPNMIVEYIVPIIVIVIAILVGQTVFGTGGVLLSGQPLKIAMQCGFSLTQIGEFAFIIASLGVSLGVTSHFLYPIVVAVSVITTFLTPYMIRLSAPAYRLADRYIPVRWKHLLERYATGVQTVNHQTNWQRLVSAIVRIVIIYSVLSVAVTIVSLHFFVPMLVSVLGDGWGRLAGAVLTIGLLSPFLRALVMKKNHSAEFRSLWADNRFNRAPLLSLVLLRIVIAVSFLVYVINHLYQASVALMVGIAIVAVLLMILSRFLKKQSIILERVFVQNLRSKDMRKEYLGEKQPEYAGRLLDRDLHLSDFVIPADSLWAGHTLQELDWGKKYDVHVASIIRGTHRINIPGGGNRIYPNDTLQVIGTDEQLSLFAAQAEAMKNSRAEEDFELHEMYLKQFVIDARSPFCGRTIRESGIRNRYRCLVVGIESADDGSLRKPDVNVPFGEKDIVWVVGEKTDLARLFNA